jgi:hypothetical protein
MEQQDKASPEPTPEQRKYAKILEMGMYAGLACLFITFAVYVLGIMEPYIPLQDLPHQWGKPVTEYLADAKIETGWAWLGMLNYGDFVNFIGVAALAGVTIVCYLAIVPQLLRSKDVVYAVLALLEVLVLALAASGVIAAGH